MMKIYAKVFPREPKEGSESTLLALANLELGGTLKVNDVRIISGQDGPFVAMPSYKAGEADYKDFCNPTTKEFREAVAATVLDAYNRDSKWSVRDGDTSPSVDVFVSKFDKDRIRAIGSIVLGKEFRVNNITVRENANGNLFATMPSTPYVKDGEKKFRSICVPVEDKESLIFGSIINAAKAKIAEKEPLEAQVAAAEAAKQKKATGESGRVAEKAGNTGRD